MTLRALLGLAVAELIGAAVLTLLCADLKRWHATAKMGLSFGLGLVTLTVSLFVASWCGLKPVWWFGVLEMAVLWAAAFVFRREQLAEWRPQESAERFPAPWNWQRTFEVALAALVIGLCAVVSAAAWLDPLVEWDVIAIWGLKAQALFHASVSSSGYFTDITKAFSHADYPLLWPMAMAWTWSWAGTADWVVVKLLAVALLWAYAAAFYGLLRRHHDRASALLFTAVLMGLPFVLSQTSRLSSDAAMSYFAMGAFVCLYLWFCSDHNDDLRLAGFFATGILFTKKEGIGLFAIFIVVAVLGVLLRRNFRQAPRVALWLMGAPIVLTLPWFMFTKLHIVKFPELTDVSGRLSPAHFLANLDRIPPIISGAVQRFVATEDWLLFWPLLLLILMVTVFRWIKRPLLLLFLGSVLPLLMYGYIFTILESLKVEFLMEFTAHRVLFHGVGVCAFLLAQCVREGRLLPWAGVRSQQSKVQSPKSKVQSLKSGVQSPHS
jgi:hypothetical protein